MLVIALYAKNRATNIKITFIGLIASGLFVLVKTKECEDAMKSGTRLAIEKGVFGGNMQVELINDGPVSIIMDSKD